MARKWLSWILVLMLTLMLVPALTYADDAEELPYAKIDWYIGNNPMPGIPEVNEALNKYLMEKINCEVNLIIMDSAEWDSKIGTMIASGQDMGILGFGVQSKCDYAIESARGSFLAIDDLLETYGQGTKALFDDSIWDAMRINGSVYGIPSLKDNGYFISLTYNGTMAEELGIDVAGYPDFSSAMELEDLYRDAKAKRDAAYPEWADHPIAWQTDRSIPYNFALETFFNNNYFAACNLEDVMDIEGYDPNAVFNFYETPEFLEFCLQKQRLVEEGIYAYDYTTIQDMRFDGSIFGYISWGFTYTPEHVYGEKFVTKERMFSNLWTETNNFLSAGTCISSNCANPEQAMRVLELVNTDPFVATMMRFGVEGTRWRYDDEGKMTFEGTSNEDPASRSFYYWYNAPVGNLTIVNAPEALTGPDGIMLTNMIAYNKACLLPAHMGFVVDPAPIANEVAACSAIVMEFQPELQEGKLVSQDEVTEAVAEFVEKLRANGSDKIIAEVQRQIDEWLAAR